MENTSPRRWLLSALVASSAFLGGCAGLCVGGVCMDSASPTSQAASRPITPHGELSYKAAEHDIMLGPGHLFSTDLAPSPWLRFNVAYCTDGAVFSFLANEASLAG